jgi:hypothetical protein
MNGFSNANIQIINFDCISKEEDDNCHTNNDIGMIHLNEFLLKGYDCEMESQCHEDSLVNDASDFSFFSDIPVSKTNDSFSSFNSNEQITYFSDLGNSPQKETESNSMFIPTNSFVCSFDNCKKNFKYKWILDRHMIAHNKIRNYKCSYRGCTKTYKSKENLTLHVKNIHLKEKPYSCKFCSSVFSHRNGKLSRYINYFICNFVSYVFYII